MNTTSMPGKAFSCRQCSMPSSCGGPKSTTYGLVALEVGSSNPKRAQVPRPSSLCLAPSTLQYTMYISHPRYAKFPSVCFGSAPEVLARESVDEKVDMWALGVVMWIMLTGQHPFGANSDLSEAEVARRVTEVEPDLKVRKRFPFWT